MTRLPDAVVARFRASALERVERLEAAWLALSEKAGDDVTGAQLLRDLHTLKGDARIVGFEDVHRLCHKLEGLVTFAIRGGRQVPEELELVVTMGFQLVTLLLRHGGKPIAGIDLPGFVRQMDDVLADAQRAPPDDPPRRRERSMTPVPEVFDRLAAPTRERLAEAATRIYLVALGTEGEPRRQLLQAWGELAAQVGALAAEPLAPRLARHARAAMELARALDRAVDIDLIADDARVGAECVDALDTALLHALRNAVDHGVEPAAERRAGGKPDRARIRVETRAVDGDICLTVVDDGRGVDLDAVRRRGIDLGVLDAGRPVADEALLELLFHSGFSTRRQVSEVSGRGIGLDAVRSALVKVGGAIRLESRPRQGTTLTILVPAALQKLSVHLFPAASAEVAIALPGAWRVEEAPASAGARDVLALLGAPVAPVGRAPLAVRAQRGRIEALLQAAGPPGPAQVERFCPTGRNAPAEIVRAGDREAVLVRLEALQSPR